MQTFLPVADFAEQRPAAGLPAAGQAAGRDAADPAGARAARLRLGHPPGRPHVARPHARRWSSTAWRWCRVWRERGFADTHRRPRSRSSRPRSSARPRPSWPRPGCCRRWVGDEALHRSHRSNLLAKDPAFYRPRFAERFGPSPTTCPTSGPAPDDVPAAPAPEGVRVWVVRPRAHTELGACLAAGVVGLGTQSGIDVDATGLDAGRAARAGQGADRPAAGQGPAPAVGVPGRGAPGRPGGAAGRARAPGCCSARSSGDYLFQGRELLPHRRPARWDRVVPRSAARPPATPAGPAGAVPGRARPGRAALTGPAGRPPVRAPPAAARSAAAPDRGRRACRRPRGSARPATAAGCGPAGSARPATSSRPGGHRAEEVGVVVDARPRTGRASAHGGAGPDAGRGLDDRAVDAAVHDAPRRVLVGAQLDGAGHPGARSPRRARTPWRRRRRWRGRSRSVRLGQVGAHASHTRQNGWPTGSA